MSAVPPISFRIIYKRSQSKAARRKIFSLFERCRVNSKGTFNPKNLSRNSSQKILASFNCPNRSTEIFQFKVLATSESWMYHQSSASWHTLIHRINAFRLKSLKLAIIIEPCLRPIPSLHYPQNLVLVNLNKS